jgi:hypothetical protein
VESALCIVARLDPTRHLRCRHIPGYTQAW